MAAVQCVCCEQWNEFVIASSRPHRKRVFRVPPVLLEQIIYTVHDHFILPNIEHSNVVRQRFVLRACWENMKSFFIVHNLAQGACPSFCI